MIGPLAQEALRPWLDRDPDAYCFSPAEVVAARNARQRAGRRSPMTPSQAARPPKPDPKRAPGRRYTRNAYRVAIQRACVKAGVPIWAPLQLRHTAATAIRARYGLEAAQVVLGHAKADVTAGLRREGPGPGSTRRRRSRMTRRVSTRSSHDRDLTIPSLGRAAGHSARRPTGPAHFGLLTTSGPATLIKLLGAQMAKDKRESPATPARPGEHPSPGDGDRGHRAGSAARCR